MEDETLKSSCQIERIGKIINLNEKAALIIINDKHIEVPLNKVAEGINLGDFVMWTGGHWSRKLSP